MILVVDMGNTKLKLLFFEEYPFAFCFVEEELEKILKYFKKIYKY
jgi:hypothetical protein